MARYLLLTFAFLIAGIAASAQQSLQGTMTDAESGEPIIFGTVALYKNGKLITGTETDLDGFYSIPELDPGTYDVAFSYTGYQELRITDVEVSASKANKLDAKISAGVTLTEIVVTYEKPLIEQDNTTQGKTLSSEEIKNLPTRNVNALASLSAGVASADEGDDLSIRGSRANATNYYLDGIRVSGRMIPKQNIEQLQVITGGVEARYGDVTGGIISITSKGPSDKFSGGAEVETSKYLDPYNQTLASLNLSGPIWKRKGETVIGYRIGGQYQYNLDDDPPAIPVYRVKDEVLAQLEANPIRIVGETAFPEAEYVTNEGVNKMDYKPNEERNTYDLNAKIDANIGKNVDVTFSGTYYRIADKFTPTSNPVTSFSSTTNYWQVFNSQNNPTDYDNRYRGNVRLRHRLGGNSNTGSSDDDKSGKGSLIQNAVYILQFGYEKEQTDRADKNHGDNLFDYGYIGKFDIGYEPSFTFDQKPGISVVGTDTFPILIISGQHTDYSERLLGYTPNESINPILTRYIANPDDNTSLNDFLVINGRIPGDFQNVWTNLHAGVGMVYNLNRKRNNDLYTFIANTSFQLVPSGSGKSRHEIQFGIMYEQRTRRGYDINPIGLWTTAQGHVNEHIEGQGLDSTNIIGYSDPQLYRTINLFTGETFDTLIPYPIYAPNIATNSENTFYRKVREANGNVPLNQYFNIDGLTPDQMRLDWFSARELNDEGIVDYWGYDYLGNRLDNVTFDDFFTQRNAEGIRTFPVAAYTPNYQAAFIQDKFQFKDVIFRIGLRVDRYDANTKVLKDPYSLYEIISASEFDNKFGTSRPGNIGADYKVYVTSEDGETVQAYRDGDTWYYPNGNPANDGSEIYGGSLVYPRYKEEIKEKRDVTSGQFDPNISFQDYEPQINWMPRLAFSFPISDDANFFAHYDVLAQRPPSNNFVSPLDYFYWETRNTLRDNANLRPERTVDYEVGFQQRLGNTSALKLSAYYKELRDMIQSRFFAQVPAPVNTYQTYDNLDFATVKGFVISYELRRTGNISLNLSYTLQFANGTGSDANSSRSISSRGIQRTLNPLSFDERHRLSGILDYRYGSGKKYNGPKIGGLDILANTGLNLTAIAVSGRPYTAAVEPNALDARGISGAINGSRLPWNFTLNAQLDKSFNLTKPGAARSLGLNVYLRVSNLLDRKNIIGVYRFTGSPDDDGFLRSADGQSFIQGGISDGRSLDGFLASYQWRLLNPDNYSLPRRIFLGATLDF
ncbi:MAG: carboxypeptidase regulatory-like domain-containing protein [Saprospiraceae bacterium]